MLLIKSLRFIFRFLFVLLLGSYTAACLFFDTPRGQRWLAGKVASGLAEHIGARVEIGKAALGLPGHIRLHNIRLYDRADSLMIRADMLEGSVSPIELLTSNAIHLRSMALLDGEAFLYKERGDTALNIQFFIDAFKGKDDVSQPTDVKISRLVLRRCRVRYDRLDRPAPLAEKFSTDHIDIQDLSASLALPALTDSLLHLKINSLNFKERSGFLVEDFHTELWKSDGKLKLRDFDLKLPASHLAQHELTLTFSESDPLHSLHTSGTLADARISTDDLAPIVPALAPLHTHLSLSSAFDITPTRLVLNAVDLAADRPSASFRGDLQIERDHSGIKTVVLRSDRLAANVPSLSQALQAIGKTAFPDIAQRLEGVDFQGDISWQRDSETKFDGILATTQGSLRGHATYDGRKAQGDVYIDNLRLASLLGDATLPEPLTATANGTVTFANGEPQSFDGELSLVQAVWQAKQISHITAEGHADRQRIDLRIDSKDTDATLYGRLQADLNGTNLQNVEWKGEVNRFRPAAWGIDAPQDMTMSFDGTLQADGLAQLATLDGDAHLNHLRVNGGGWNIDQQDLSLNLKPIAEGHDISLATAYGDVSLRGALDINRLRSTVERLIARAVPDFAPLILKKMPTEAHFGDGKWIFHADIVNDALFQDVLHLPISAPQGLIVDGTLAEGKGYTSITLNADTLCYDGQGFRDVSAYLRGEKEEYALLVQTQKNLAGMTMDLAATIQTTGHELTTLVSWQDKKNTFRGELSANTFPLEGKKGIARTELKPTEVFFKDSVWTVHGGTVLWGADTLAVNHLYVEHGHQNVVVDGSSNAGSPDSITVKLQDIDLEYVFDLLKFHPVYFAGIASGRAVLTFAHEKPIVKALLDIEDFSINNGALGRADIKGEVDLSSQLIRLDADLLDAPHGRTLVTGTVQPREEMLDLNIMSLGTNLEFLRRYIGGFLHDISGRATGTARLYGTFKELQLGGDVMANISGDLPVLGCSYNVDSAHVVMTPGLIDIRSGLVRDKEGGTARAAGQVRHRFLGNFHYGFDFDLDHCLIYDRPRTSDLTFSSHALASGHISLKGEPNRLDCDIDVRPERGTNFRYHMDLPEDYSSSTLLHIRPASESTTGAPLADDPDPMPPTSTSDVYMTLNLDMQPDVPLTVVMDEKTGDNIVVRGRGPLRATYYNKGQFNLFGTYTVETGTYKMTIQDIIHKDFRFEQGGTVIFNGKPFDGIMDMQAIYTVPSASLADLNLTGGVSQNGVRVNCLLNFSGQLSDPKVRFDLDMPTVSQDVKQMVRSLISTDEEMNRQVLYLLAIGRFYTYDYATTENTQSQGETAMNSFLSNTLSGQLNNFISSAMGQNNWTFGTNVSTGTYGWEDVGVEGRIGGRLLNNRLLINGNFGYRNSVTRQNGNFVGDFDVQYLLTPGGSIRLKAYNETNDRYFTKNSLTTQGAGIVVQRSFNRLSDLFKKKKKVKK